MKTCEKKRWLQHGNSWAHHESWSRLSREWWKCSSTICSEFLRRLARENPWSSSAKLLRGLILWKNWNQRPKGIGIETVPVWRIPGTLILRLGNARFGTITLIARRQDRKFEIWVESALLASSVTWRAHVWTYAHKWDGQCSPVFMRWAWLAHVLASFLTDTSISRFSNICVSCGAAFWEIGQIMMENDAKSNEIGKCVHES